MQLNELFTEMAEALRTKEDTTNKISAESFPQRIKDLKVLDTTDATVTSDDVVAGKIAYANGKRVIGTVIDNGKLEYIPSDEDQFIPAGKTSGGIVKAINSEEIIITPKTESQVKEGLFNKVLVNGIETEDLRVTPTTEEQKFNGLFENVIVEAGSSGIDTSDATATAGDIAKGKTAYVNGEKVTGIMKGNNYNAVTLDILPSGSQSVGSGIRGIIKELHGNYNCKTTSCDYMFYAQRNLEYIEALDTTGVTSMLRMFCDAYRLKTLPELNAEKVKNITGMFSMETIGKVFALENFEGLKDLGKAYTEKRSGYDNYDLNLSDCPNLTHESLINIINNLYDLNLTYGVNNGGTLYSQKLVLGSTNIAKLTSEEIAVATNKGWTVS